MRWSQITECGPVRRRNEDWLCAYPEIGFFAVADGMGGHKAGDVASKLALEVMKKTLENYRPSRNTALDQLRQGVIRANEAVYVSAQKYMEHRGMGTTLTACLLHGDKVFVANVGDSRALLIREGKTNKLTSDHSLVQELLDGGGITEKDAFKHPQRNVLTRALGIGPTVHADYFTYDIVKGDRLLLCTDGLSAFVTEDRLGELMMSSENPDDVVRLLLKEAINAGSNDNITMIFMAVD